MSPRRIAAPVEPTEPADVPGRLSGHHSEWCPEPDYCPSARGLDGRDPRWVLRQTPEEEAAECRAYMAVHYSHLTSVGSPDERPAPWSPSVTLAGAEGNPKLLPEVDPRRPRRSSSSDGISRGSRALRQCGRCGTEHRQQRCPECYPPWAGSTRKASLPADWQKISAAVIARDPVCTLQLDGCQGASVQADHIGDRLDHRMSNLRGVCVPCHLKRTSQQAHAAQARPARKGWQ